MSSTDSYGKSCENIKKNNTMKTLILSILALTLVSQSAISQNDTLNRFDVNLKETGWWIVYLDKDLAVTTDTDKAKYYRYSYFDGKFDYFNMGKIGTNKNPVIAPASSKSSNDIQAINGEYRVNYGNGQTKFVLTAQNGKLKEYKEFYKDGTLKTLFDYTESCGATPFHYCIYLYKKDGSLKTKTTIQTPKK